MASEIQLVSDSGKTMYALIRHPDGRFWDVSSDQFATFTMTTVAQFAIPLTEAPLPGLYIADFPTRITEQNRFLMLAMIQAGATPSSADGLPVAVGIIEWSGNREVTIPSIVTGGASNQVKINVGHSQKIVEVQPKIDTGSVRIHTSTQPL